MPRWLRGTTIVCCSERMDPFGPWVRTIAGNWEMEASSNGDSSVDGNLTAMPPTVRETEMMVRSTGRLLPPTATDWLMGRIVLMGLTIILRHHL